MRKSAHCRLCDNHIRNSEKGIFCGLTMEKPTFSVKCDKVDFRNALCKKIEVASFGLHVIHARKAGVFLHFGLYLAISLLFLLAGYFAGKYIFDMGVISTGPLIIMGIGLVVFPVAFRPLVRYRQELSVAELNTEEISQVLDLYNMSYEVSFDVRKGNHGIWDVSTQVSVIKGGKKAGTYTNSFAHNNNPQHEADGVSLRSIESQLSKYVSM